MIGIDALVGIGIIGVLLRMNHTLGKLCSKVDMGIKVQDDHEDRLRILEHIS